FHTDLARDGTHLIGKRCQRVGHVIDSVGEFCDLALRFHGQFSFQIAGGHGRHNARDTTNLICKVAGHRVHIVGQVFPRARHTTHVSLPSELAFSTYFARHSSPLSSLSFHVSSLLFVLLFFVVFVHFTPSPLPPHCIFFKKPPVPPARPPPANPPPLPCRVAAHRFHFAGQFFPGPRHTTHI